jgi:hypothetical protein
MPGAGIETGPSGSTQAGAALAIAADGKNASVAKIDKDRLFSRRPSRTRAVSSEIFVRAEEVKWLDDRLHTQWAVERVGTRACHI